VLQQAEGLAELVFLDQLVDEGHRVNDASLTHGWLTKPRSGAFGRQIWPLSPRLPSLVQPSYLHSTGGCLCRTDAPVFGSAARKEHRMLSDGLSHRSSKGIFRNAGLYAFHTSKNKACVSLDIPIGLACQCFIVVI
jgi:hypothetical protein